MGRTGDNHGYRTCSSYKSTKSCHVSVTAFGLGIVEVVIRMVGVMVQGVVRVLGQGMVGVLGQGVEGVVGQGEVGWLG